MARPPLGVLFRHGEVLQALHDVEAVAIDKTGTASGARIRKSLAPLPEVACPGAVQKPEVSRPHNSLDAGANAQQLIGLFQVLLDGSPRNAEDLASVARALALLCPAQALKLTLT